MFTRWVQCPHDQLLLRRSKTGRSSARNQLHKQQLSAFIQVANHFEFQTRVNHKDPPIKSDDYKYNIYTPGLRLNQAP